MQSQDAQLLSSTRTHGTLEQQQGATDDLVVGAAEFVGEQQKIVGEENTA